MFNNIFFQVGPTDQLGNGNSLDSQTNEFSSSNVIVYDYQIVI